MNGRESYFVTTTLKNSLAFFDFKAYYYSNALLKTVGLWSDILGLPEPEDTITSRATAYRTPNSYTSTS